MLEELRTKYQIMWEQAEPASTQEAAYAAITRALYDAKTLLDAKNNLHVLELMSSPGIAQNEYRSARLELERAMLGL